jgi:hypothetical protein
MSLHRESPKHFGGIQTCLLQLKPTFKLVIGKKKDVFYESVVLLLLFFQKVHILFL